MPSRGQGDTARAGGLEVRPVVALYRPVGDYRALLSDGPYFGVQLGYAFLPELALTASVGIARTRDKVAADPSGVTMLQYDAAAEARWPRAARVRRREASWWVEPYLSLGLGGRTYRDRPATATERADTGVAQPGRSVSFGALGVDVARPAHRVSLRVEARTYITSFRGIGGAFDPAEDHNDVVLATSFTLPLRRAPRVSRRAAGSGPGAPVQ